MLGNTTGKHRYSGPVVVEKECGPARLPSNFSLQPFQAYLREMGMLLYSAGGPVQEGNPDESNGKKKENRVGRFPLDRFCKSVLK